MEDSKEPSLPREAISERALFEIVVNPHQSEKLRKFLNENNYIWRKL